MPSAATTPTAGVSDVGDTWLLGVEIRDDFTAELVDAAVAVVVTLPDDTTAAPVVERISLGSYAASYELLGPGRHFAVAAVSGDVVSVVTFATDAVEPGGTIPDLAAVKVYLGASADRWTDAELTDALNTELAAQARACRIGATYPDDLGSALKRRVQRQLAMRALPLAVLQADAEGGSTLLPGRDPEVRRLEAGHRRLVVG